MICPREACKEEVPKDFQKKWKECVDSNIQFLRSLEAEPKKIPPLPEILDLIEKCFEKVLCRSSLFKMISVGDGRVDIIFPGQVIVASFEPNNVKFVVHEEYDEYISDWKSYCIERCPDGLEYIRRIQEMFENNLL